MRKTIFSIADLNGQWALIYMSDCSHEEYLGDGVRADLALLDGKASGTDVLGAVWTATYAIEDGHVAFKATVDASKTAPNVALVGADGAPTRDPQTYEGRLELYEFKGNIGFRGKLSHGLVGYRVQAFMEKKRGSNASDQDHAA